MINIKEDMILKSYDNKITGVIKYWNNEKDNGGNIVSLSGEYRSGIEILKFILPILANENNNCIIDFSNLKYSWGDDFFEWYSFLRDIYIDISIEESNNNIPNKITPLCSLNKIVLVVSDNCKDGIISLINDEEEYQLLDTIFYSLDEAIDFFISD